MRDAEVWKRDPSPISSRNPHIFHFWDPDGNAVNIWTYAHTQPDHASYGQ